MPFLKNGSNGPALLPDNYSLKLGPLIESIRAFAESLQWIGATTAQPPEPVVGVRLALTVSHPCAKKSNSGRSSLPLFPPFLSLFRCFVPLVATKLPHDTVVCVGVVADQVVRCVWVCVWMFSSMHSSVAVKPGSDPELRCTAVYSD